MKPTYTYIASGFILLFLYTNCGQGFVANGDFLSDPSRSLSSVTCESIKSNSFNSDGFHSFLVKNCAACHSSGGAQGLFASNDSSIAFQTFNSFGWARIKENALDDLHPGPLNGPGLAGRVNSLDAQWTSVSTKYDDCVRVQNATAGGQFDLITEEVDLDVADAWKTYSWDLSQNLFSGEQDHTLDLQFKVDIQNYYGEGEKPENPIGLLMKQPRLTFTGSENRVYLEGIQFMSDGVPLDNFEVWGQLFILINKQDENAGQVADSIIIGDEQRRFAFISDDVAQVRSLSILFTNIIDNTDGLNAQYIPKEPNEVVADSGKPVITDRITYADLTGDGKYGVLKKNCFSCHAGGVSRGNFSLATYNSASSGAAMIAERINDSGKPMPPSGLLAPKDIAAIEKWIELGTPE